MVLECFAQISMATLAFCILGSALIDPCMLGQGLSSQHLFPFVFQKVPHCTAVTATHPRLSWGLHWKQQTIPKSSQHRRLGNADQSSDCVWDPSLEGPDRVMLSLQKGWQAGAFEVGLQMSSMGSLSLPGPSYLWVFPCGTLQA